ncbi:MAG: non-canonical purine NTP pyrophosphatase, RdgB/HAM1 family [Hyphomicrobiales bacterium]|nr:MAG: non-canonical purine NTP pyrophosphatase, RdgB/HAM1 family [Hyphomicrobiales bacterium]
MTARIFSEKKLIVASHNAGKVREVADLVAGIGVETVSAGDLGLAEPEETGTTFEANARLKAEAAVATAGLPAIADDSGLAVEALGGDPGIYSARWAGPTKDFAQAMRNIEEKLQALGATTPDQRRAKFVCALCLAWPDGHLEEVRGEVHGTLVWPPRGTAGFGYDPIFLPDGFERTFGEMTAEEKHGWVRGQGNPLSHRARAFAELVARCFPQ